MTLLNKAARRQFVDQPGVRVADFAAYGAEFVAALGLPPSGRRLTQLIKDGVAQRVMIETARIERLGSNLRIVSVLPVQNVLGAAEMAAQSGLVRVLTHEIMNSLTPVTSLVRSAADILATAEKDPQGPRRSAPGGRDRRQPRRGHAPLRRDLPLVRAAARNPPPPLRRRAMGGGNRAAVRGRSGDREDRARRHRPGGILARRRSRSDGAGVPQPAAQCGDRGAQPRRRAAGRDDASSRAGTAAPGSRFTTMVRASIPTGARIFSCPFTPPGPTAPASASASPARSSSPTAEQSRRVSRRSAGHQSSR